MVSVGRRVAVQTVEDLGAVGNDARGDTLEVDVVLLVMASVTVAVMGKDLSAVGHGAGGGGLGPAGGSGRRGAGAGAGAGSGPGAAMLVGLVAPLLPPGLLLLPRGEGWRWWRGSLVLAVVLALEARRSGKHTGAK